MRNYEADGCDPGRYQQTVAPNAEPLTLDQVKDQCSLQNTDLWDNLLTDFISEARRIIEKRHERQLLPATWTLSLDTFPDEITLRKTPVTGVTSVTYVDQTGALQTWPSTNYQVDFASPNQSARLRPVWGVIFPITRTGYLNSVVVTFTAGYADAASVPVGYRRAMLMIVSELFKNRGMNADMSASANRAFDWLMDAEDPGASV